MEGWMGQREGKQEGFHRQHVTEEWFFNPRTSSSAIYVLHKSPW